MKVINSGEINLDKGHQIICYKLYINFLVGVRMETPKNKIITPIQSKKHPNEDRQESGMDTATKRRVSDILVMLHKYVQEWQTNNQLSFEVVNTLCSLYSKWDSLDDGDTSKIIELCKIQYNAKLYFIREDLIQQLKTHEKKLKELYSKMAEIVVNFKAIYFMGLSSGNNTVEIFNSWCAEKFYSTTRLILNMYSKEYMLKITLYCKFFEYRVESDEDHSALAMLNKYVSIWLHQPFVNGEKSKFLLDAMLIEAELKDK